MRSHAVCDRLTMPGLAEWRDQAGLPYAGIVTIEGETIPIDCVRAAR